MEKSVKDDTWRCCIKITVVGTKDVGLSNAALLSQNNEAVSVDIILEK